MTEETKQAITLDHNGQIPVKLEARPDGKLEIVIDAKTLNSRHLLGQDGHFRNGGLDATIDGKVSNSDIIYNRSNKTLHLTVHDVTDNAKHVALTLYGEPIIDWRRGDIGGWAFDSKTSHHRLTVNELRILGIAERRPPGIPVSRKKLQGFDPTKHNPITDLHTHSSAQMSAKEFMELGVNHQIDYPLELLSLLGIELTEEELAYVRNDGKGLKFDPTINEGLACEQGRGTYDVIPLSRLNKEHRDRIERQLSVPQDLTLCFSEFDAQGYRFLNPLAKNPVLAKPMLYRIGESYAKEGIKYAELSTGSMLQLEDGKAKWFREMVEAVDEVEKKHGVRMRFLVGIPRSQKPQAVLEALEKIKYAARHPYIAGVDILGYENNKAKELTWALEHISDWATRLDDDLDVNEGWNFKRDFLVRTHAGETEKNEGNVAESVRIAERSGVRFRIAHAIHEKLSEELNARIRRLVRRDHFALGFEFCPISWVAFNNAISHDDSPLMRWPKVCPNWFLGPDGAGLVQSTPTQLSLAALAAGMKIKDLEHMRKNEERYIEDERARNAEKMASFEKHYGAKSVSANEAFFKGFEEQLTYVKSLMEVDKTGVKPPTLPKQYNNKVALMVTGSGGTSWLQKMTDFSRTETPRMLDLLSAAIDQDQIYLLGGRAKEEGVTKALGDAVTRKNSALAEGQKRQSLLFLNTSDTTDIPSSIDWIVPMQGGKEKIASNNTTFMKTRPTPGISIFIGGGATTGDMITQTMRDPNANYLLMENAGGASQAYAQLVHDHRKFSDRYTLVQRVAEILQKLYPDRNFFKEGVDPFDRASLAALEQQLAEKNTPATAVTGDTRTRDGAPLRVTGAIEPAASKKVT